MTGGTFSCIFRIIVVNWTQYEVLEVFCMEAVANFEEIFAELYSVGIYFRAPSALLCIACYALSALGLYAIASRRGIHHAWLSWIPIGNVWLLGAISDHYRFVTRGETKSRRKALLTLSIISLVLVFVMVIVCGMAVFQLLVMFIEDVRVADFTELGIQVLIMVLLAIPLSIISIVNTVLQYIALYDIFSSADPQNKVLYLLLSIFCGSFAQPLILFFNRNRDGGMPPRIPEPQYQPPCDPYIPPQN